MLTEFRLCALSVRSEFPHTCAPCPLYVFHKSPGGTGKLVLVSRLNRVCVSRGDDVCDACEFVRVHDLFLVQMEVLLGLDRCD